jgi:hypothetical protein
MSEYEKIAVLMNEVEAELVESTLKDRGIPHVLKPYHDSALDGLFERQEGWGHIEAPSEHKEAILTILRDLETEAPGDNADA